MLTQKQILLLMIVAKEEVELIEEHFYDEGCLSSLETLCYHGLIQMCTDENITKIDNLRETEFYLTEKGEYLVTYLTSVPLPTKKTYWEI